MKRNFFNRTIKGNIVVIDSTFPQKKPFGFRNIEINAYLNRVKNLEYYSMYPMEPWGDAWFPWSYGPEEQVYLENKTGYLKHYPENDKKIHYIDRNKRYDFKLAYSYFLAETYVLLPFYEKNKIPFVFVLYPGGSFGIDNVASDKMLARIFNSNLFRGVIVTQKITEEYLLRKHLCDKDKMHYIFGGFSQIDKSDVVQKNYYRKDKQTFDICFVAGKYSEHGRDKGYDLFIEAAKKLSAKLDDVRFHVVGGFGPADIDIGDCISNFKFYGYKSSEFLLKLYANMDIYFSVNRPGMLYQGNFDGFPLAIDAPFCGVAQFTSDELGMNRGQLLEDEEIVILGLDSDAITQKVLYYYMNLDELYELSLKGQKKAQQLFNVDYQIDERIKVFKRITHVETVKL